MKTFFFNHDNNRSIKKYFISKVDYELSKIPVLPLQKFVILDGNDEDKYLDISREDGLILFAHIKPGRQKTWTDFAQKAGNRIELIIMSSEPVTAEAGWTHNIHPLGYSAVNLENNERVAAFFGNIETSLDWSLLIPPPIYSDALITAYFLLIAEQHGLFIDELDGSGLWEDAGKQLNDAVKKNNLDIKPIPCSRPGSPEEREQYLSSLRSLFATLSPYKSSSILVAPGIDCEANEARSTIFHDWLPDIVEKTPEQVAAFVSDIAGWPPLEKFKTNAKSTIHFAKSLVKGFSPKQIIDDHMLAVPKSKRAQLKRIIHKQYLETTKMDEVSCDLLEAANKLSNDIKYLLLAWNKKNEEIIASTYQTVLNSAEAVKSFDEKLPKGVALP